MSSSRKPARIDPERCKGCELCVVVCRRNVLRMTDKLSLRGNRVVAMDAVAQCDACGRCFLICPDNAIEAD